MSGKVSIVHVIHTLQVGGAETYAISLANKLSRQKKNDIYLAFGNSHSHIRSRICPSVNLFGFNYFGGTRGTTQIKNLPLLIKFRRFLVKKRIDLVHIHSRNVGFWFAIAAKSLGVPTVFTPMTIRQKGIPIEYIHPQYGFLARIVDSLFDQYLILSDYYYQEWLTERGVSRNKLYLNKLGIDTGTFHPPHDTSQVARLRAHFDLPQNGKMCAIASRLFSVKRVEKAIRGLARFSQETSDVFLAIAGDGPERLSLERLAYDLGVSAHTHFLGKVDNVPQFLRSADLYIQTTRVPNMGLATLEAMASGLPLIIYASSEEEVAMASETCVEGLNGYIVRNIDELANRMTDVFLNLERTADMKRASRRLAIEQFNFDLHLENLDTMYRQLV